MCSDAMRAVIAVEWASGRAAAAQVLRTAPVNPATNKVAKAHERA